MAILRTKPLTLTSALTLTEARRVCLEAQGLGVKSTPFGLGAAGVLAAIERLGYVQLDTISVVERAHHHVIWSRVSSYTPTLLHDLMARDRKVFEYWSHAASILPMKDYRFSMPRMKAFADGKRHWFKQNRRMMSYVLDRIRAEGPLQARHFEAPPGHKGGTWFDWKPSKQALERLYLSGALMVRERKGFEKVYDLAERVLPSGLDVSFPAPQEVARHLVLQTLRAHGLALEPEMRYLRQGMQTEIRDALTELEDSGEIVRVKVQDCGKADHFALKNTVERALGISDSVAAGASAVRLLSPFDNLVIQRKRLSRLFGFDYLIECYVPEAKRRFGYFCLPVLWGDRLVGRIDAKAERAERKLVVHQIHLEPCVTTKERARLKDPLREALREFAAFNQCDKFVVRNR